MKYFRVKDRWISPDLDDIEDDLVMLYDTLDQYDIAFDDGDFESGPGRAWEIFSLMEKGKAWEPVGGYSPEEVYDILKRFGQLEGYN